MSYVFVGGFACGVFTCIAIHWAFKRLEMLALMRTARETPGEPK